MPKLTITIQDKTDLPLDHPLRAHPGTVVYHCEHDNPKRAALAETGDFQPSAAEYIALQLNKFAVHVVQQMAAMKKLEKMDKEGKLEEPGEPGNNLPKKGKSLLSPAVDWNEQIKRIKQLKGEAREDEQQPPE